MEGRQQLSNTSRRVAELIALGRDREAADLAITHSLSSDSLRSEEKGKPMDPLDQLDQLGPILAGVVGGIRRDELDNPTPCANFTVRGVLDHMLAGATTFTAAFRGVSAEEPPPSDPLTGFGAALTALGEAMHSPGALDRTIQAPFGEVPGEEFARFVVLDGLVHGWDLATATGQPYTPPEDLVAAVHEFAQRSLDPLRDGDTFGHAVTAPPDASAIERLVALTGRNPGVLQQT